MTDSALHRYRAFISYSQRDQQQAKRLQRALETYRVPRGIEASLTPDRRLGRVFRDVDEMSASTDLGATLRGALQESENLIVICSPEAARSKWVNAEVLHFKALGRGDRIFAAIVDGTPNSGDPASECFPPALRFEVVGDSLLSERRAEPLGVDLRNESFARARVRLVAGLMGISFDTLWQREKRRAAKRRAIGAAVTVLLASVIALLGTQWLVARDRVRSQTIERTLLQIRDDLASERAGEALVQLDRLYAEGARGRVADAMAATLAWVVAPTELLREIHPPALVASGPQLFFVSSNGSRHRLDVHEPYRRILTSDRRWLMVLGADEAVVLDVGNGAEVARTPLNGFWWHGNAFQTGEGLLVIGGRFAGTTNGTIRESLLVFSPQQRSLSLFDLHWNADGRWLSHRFIDPLAVSRDCRSFGVGSATGSMQRSELFFFAADAAGLKPVPPPESLAGWQQVAMFAPEDRLGGLDQYLDGPTSAGSACLPPAVDSERPTAQPGATLAVRPVGLGSFWEPPSRWSVIGPAPVETEPDDPGRRSGTDADGSPCTEARPCPVRDAEFDEVFPVFDTYGMPGWTALARPRGVHRDDPSFDHVDRELVHSWHDHANAGITSAWCRNLSSAPACLEIRTQAELHDHLTELELRSATGRWIFYSRAMGDGFRLYDLLTMRDVTPSGPELVASSKWVDFSPNDERLFVAVGGRLLVFAPPPNGGRWQPVRSGDVDRVPALSGNVEDAVAGLFALDDTTVLVARNSGRVSRFDWRTGQLSWGRVIGGVGEIERAVISRNRRTLLVIGREGGRLVATSDGLVLSGVLVPPPAMDGAIPMQGAIADECFGGAFVSDEGAIELTCGEKEYRREPATFRGDPRSRVREILSDTLIVGSR